MWIRRTLPIMLSLVFVAACGDPDDAEQQDQQQDQQQQDEEEGPDLVDPSADSQDLLNAIDDYGNWGHFAGNDSHMQTGHPGDIYVISHANEAANDALANDTIPYPEDSIIVKEEYGEDGADDPDAVTVMQKLSDDAEDWYWLKATADLQQVIDHPDAGPLEGSGDDAPPGCVDCHGQASDTDLVVQHGD